MKQYVLKLKEAMERAVGCPIEVVEDTSNQMPCTIEYARNYMRDHHVIRVNPAMGGGDYAVFSLLLLIKLQLEQLPDGAYGISMAASSAEECVRFADMVQKSPEGVALQRQLGPARYDGFVGSIRAGIATQATNQVLEMLANDVVVREYPEALEDMKDWLRQSVATASRATREQLCQMFPAYLVDTSRVLNVAFAMSAQDRCGDKLVDMLKPTDAEIDAGLDLYNFFRKERDAMRESGHIVNLVVANILKYLKLDAYVHLTVREIAPVSMVAPVDDGLTEHERQELEEFKKNFGDANDVDSAIMALAMFKVLVELKSWPLNEVKALAVETAMLGTGGLSPKGTYELKAFGSRGKIPGREVLAYYYVSWAIAFPDKLDLLGLPFKRAYESALSMYNAKCANSTKTPMGGGVICRISYALAA